MRILIVFFALFGLSTWAVADVTPPVIENHTPAPPNGNTGNNWSYKPGSGANGAHGTMTVSPSSPKSHFQGQDVQRGTDGRVFGYRPVNATVNNGYGNTGTIATQASSTFSKAGLRSGINSLGSKALGVLAGIQVAQQSYSLGSKIYNIYDQQVYGTPLPSGWPYNEEGAQPIPNAAPQPEPSQKVPKGAYNSSEKYLIVVSNDAQGNSPIAVFSAPWKVSASGVGSKTQVCLGSTFCFVSESPWYAKTVTSTPELAQKYASLFPDILYPPQVTGEDFYNATIWALENMPEQIATGIMNALHDGGFLGAPESTTFDPASYTSPPYTAADTGVAQQDKFTINKDGSITHQVVARPDLQGSQLAPITPPVTSPTNPTTPKDPAKPTDPAPPLDLAVPDVGIPMDEVTFNLDLGGFKMPAYCPEPRTFEAMGNTFSISYQPFCDFAGMLKGIIILMATISAYFIVSKGAD